MAFILLLLWTLFTAQVDLMWRQLWCGVKPRCSTGGMQVAEKKKKKTTSIRQCVSGGLSVIDTWSAVWDDDSQTDSWWLQIFCERTHAPKLSAARASPRALSHSGHQKAFTSSQTGRRERIWWHNSRVPASHRNKYVIFHGRVRVDGCGELTRAFINFAPRVYPARSSSRPHARTIKC